MNSEISHIITAIIVILIFWTITLIRKYDIRQKQALTTQSVAVERQQHAIQQVEESLSLARKQLENQEKIISLLEQIRDGKTGS